MLFVLCGDKKAYNYSLRFNCINQEKVVNQLCYVYHMYMKAYNCIVNQMHYNLWVCVFVCVTDLIQCILFHRK